LQVQVVNQLHELPAPLELEGARYVVLERAAGDVDAGETHDTAAHLVDHETVERHNVGMVRQAHPEVDLIPPLLDEVMLPVVLEDGLPGHGRVSVGLVRDEVDVADEAVQLSQVGAENGLHPLGPLEEIQGRVVDALGVVVFRVGRNRDQVAVGRHVNPHHVQGRS
jgi:hypothetical protein